MSKQVQGNKIIGENSTHTGNMGKLLLYWDKSNDVIQ